MIIKIDGRPALDVFKEDIGIELARDLNQVAGLIFAALPIMGSDTGDYLVRNLVGIDLDKKLVAIGEAVSPGMSILFTRRDVDKAHQELVNMLERLKASLKGRRPKGGCTILVWGAERVCLVKIPRIEDDSEGFLGDFPLVGFLPMVRFIIKDCTAIVVF